MVFSSNIADPKLMVEFKTTASPITAELGSFTNGAGVYPGFDFTRYWWKEGRREGIKPWVLRKLKPGDDPVFGWAAKSEILAPATAPGEYANLSLLLDRFDSTLPPFEAHVMIQVKIALDPVEPWHVGYERVRSYAREHFGAKGHAAILVAHVPNVAGLDGYGSHVHCIVLARRIGINGFTGACYELCSDRGHEAAWKAWCAHLAKGARV